jgi:UDPglucose 6-dehydrogenase
MARTLCGSLEGKRVSILGLAFKAGTDDIRESVPMALAKALIREGAEVTAYDPAAMQNARGVLGAQVTFAKNAKGALRGSECAFIATAWDDFRRLRPIDFKALMASPVVIDGRRVYDQGRYLRSGVRIATIGTGPHRGGKWPSDQLSVAPKEWHYVVRDGKVHSYEEPM